MNKNLLIVYVILFSILSCQKNTPHKLYSKIVTAPGPEDIVLDKANNRILVSCDERRTGMALQAAIMQIDLNTDICTALPIVNMPSIPFHPHGFDLQTVNGIDYLYIINHYRDSAYTNAVLQFEIKASQLEFVREYKHPLLISPNDITVLPNGAFYFSNDKNSSNILEMLYSPYGGSVVYCNGATTWQKVDSIIGFPNGLYDEGDALYLATSRNYAMYKYEMQSDGTLKNRKRITAINGMDTIIENGDDLIVSVHPDEIKFALLSYFPQTLSPSKTYAINKQTGQARLIFDDDGKKISGSSTALVHGNDLYLAQVFDGFVLKIANYKY